MSSRAAADKVQRKTHRLVIVGLTEHVVLAAVGIDSGSEKHVREPPQCAIG